MKGSKHPNCELEIRTGGKGGRMRYVHCEECAKAKGSKAKKGVGSGEAVLPPAAPAKKKDEPPPPDKKRRGLFF
jgi:hypothetical protein